jgi:hypothetical protein
MEVKREQRITDWEQNRVGSFRLLEHLRGVTQKGVGHVWTALHRETGLRALVAVQSGAADWQPAADWIVRVHGRTGERPSVMVEVERSPESARAVSEMADGLDIATGVMAHAERIRSASNHLTARPVRLRWQARARRAAAVVVVAAVACGVLSGLAARWLASPMPGDVPQALTAGLGDSLQPADSLPVNPEEVLPVIGLEMPRTPFKGQRTPGRDGKCPWRSETPINGGCWMGMKMEPPCGQEAYEYEGVCYRPTFPAKPEPRSEGAHPQDSLGASQ